MQIIFHTTILTIVILGPWFIAKKLKKVIDQHEPSDYAKARKHLFVKERERIEYYRNLRFCNWVNKNYEDLYELWQDDFYGIVCFDTFCTHAYSGKVTIVTHTGPDILRKIRKFMEKFNG